MSILAQLTDLFASQKLAVLATQSEGQPYSCLVAFAHTNDLKRLLFATRRDTRKYLNITQNPLVAMLIDNRSNREADFADAVAVTANGSARELSAEEHEQWSDKYLARHPYLGSFVTGENVALVMIDVEEYLIARFDSTEVFTPGPLPG